jgi:minor extracellular serine protease Vpr
MSSSSRARAMSVVAAGLTVTALFAATISVPASATPMPIPTPSSAKLKLPDGTAASRVIPGRYLVETVATPLSRGGSKFANQSATKSTTSAATAAGAKVGTSYSELWSGVSVAATDAQIKVLAQSPSVKAVYPVLRVALPKTTRSATKVSSALDRIAALGVSHDGTGIKVGVIDTGIDYNNVDLQGSGTNDETKDFGASAPRVKFGYDFVGDTYNPDSTDESDWTPHADAYPDDCEGHGTHVAGIIGANGTGDGDSTTGVAPNVTFGAYRIFGCEGSTDTAVILSALNRAKADKMNVVNLSLGSDFDSWPSYPDAVAVANLAKAGVVVAVAAGNSGDTGLFSAGSPAVGAGVISVASYEGATIRTKAISVNGVKYAYTAVDGTAIAPDNNVGQLQLKIASNITGCTADGTLTAVPAGTALLIKRTPTAAGCDYREKVMNAIAAGAAAAVIYNSDPGLGDFTAAKSGNSDLTIPAISIRGDQGANLAAALTSATPIDPTMTWLSVQADVVNPDGGQISTFSSAGLAADLSLVPTISAPGANIYSTLPIEQGGHGNLSGTSMATPYVAGAVALLLQAKPTLRGQPAVVAQRLYATAVPVAKSTEAGVTTRPEGVFRQGSGLVNVAGALNAGVTAAPSTLKLGEAKSHVVTVKLTNKTAQKLTYTASRLSGVSAVASTSGTSMGTTTPLYGFSEVGFKVYSKAITIKPGKTVKVKVKLTAPSVLSGRAGLLYGGWVQFGTTGAGNTVSVPFAGVRGDYQAVKVLNGFKPVVDAQGHTWTLPAVGFFDNNGNLTPDYLATHTFDPSSGDSPVMLYHLDYPASDVQLKVTNTKTKKSYDAVIDWSTYNRNTGKASSKSTHLYKQPRDAVYQGFYFDGGVYHKGHVYGLETGTYTLQLRVLKPLGTASKSKHWETYTSKPIHMLSTIG